MGISLSRPVSNADSRLIRQQTKIPAASDGKLHIHITMPKCKSDGVGFGEDG